MKKLIFLLFAFFTFVLAGCKEDKIIIPETDPTPPKVSLSIWVGGEETILTSESGDVHVEVDQTDAISLIATGADKDGGVKSVCISSPMTIRCTNGAFSQMMQGLTDPICNTDNKHPSETAHIKLSVARVIRIADFVDDCRPAYWFTNLSGSIEATAENFHKGTDQTAEFRFELNEAIPNISIERPIMNERFVENEVLVFKASVASESTVDESQLQWVSSRDGELGRGPEVEINRLSVGNHAIQVTGFGQKREVPIRVFNDLWDLYRSPPSQEETDRIMKDFTFSWIDGSDEDEKWAVYDLFQFDQNSTDPTKIVAIAKLDILRHQRFSEPLPFTKGKNIYDHFKTYVNTIKLRLDCDPHTGGAAYGGWVSLNRSFSVWDKRFSGTSDNPDACKTPFASPELASYISYILVHEGRHAEPDDPGHVTCNGKSNMDDTLEGGSGHAWAAMYLMWIYKYGLYDPPLIKEEAKIIAKDLLQRVFCSTPTHSNPNVQAIIDELLQE